MRGKGYSPSLRTEMQIGLIAEITSGKMKFSKALSTFQGFSYTEFGLLLLSKLDKELSL